MTETEILNLLSAGEGMQVEFKKSTKEINKDVYDTVCAFSNRDGGTIFLGVNDQGEIVGIDPAAVDSIKKDFVTSVNNAQQFGRNYLNPLLKKGMVVMMFPDKPNHRFQKYIINDHQ